MTISLTSITGSSGQNVDVDSIVKHISNDEAHCSTEKERVSRLAKISADGYDGLNKPGIPCAFSELFFLKDTGDPQLCSKKSISTIPGIAQFKIELNIPNSLM